MKVDTTAIAQFWHHFDSFLQDTTSNPFTDYLNHLAPGLKSFSPYPLGDSSRLKKTVTKELSYYKAVRPFTNHVGKSIPAMKAYCVAFSEIFPDCTAPDVYLVVGRANSGGSVNSEGVMIGAEMYSENRDSTSYGFVSMSQAEMPDIFLRCLVYYNNKPAYTGYTLLRQSVMEGTTEFLSGIVSERARQRLDTLPAFKYGNANEEKIAREFWMARNETDFSQWLYNREARRPANLGTFIGYKIVEAYYQNHPDKKKAVDEILKINDFEKFVKISGYIDQFLSY